MIFPVAVFLLKTLSGWVAKYCAKVCSRNGVQMSSESRLWTPALGVGSATALAVTANMASKTSDLVIEYATWFWPGSQACMKPLSGGVLQVGSRLRSPAGPHLPIHALRSTKKGVARFPS